MTADSAEKVPRRRQVSFIQELQQLGGTWWGSTSNLPDHLPLLADGDAFVPCEELMEFRLPPCPFTDVV